MSRHDLDEHLVTLLAPTSFEAEQYRTLRHVLEEMHKTGALTTVAVSSAAAQEGKTTTTINLAAALAEASGTRVLLADADLRRPAVGRQLGLSDRGAPGLADAVLDSRLSLSDVVSAPPQLSFSVLPAGRCPAVPYEVLNSTRFGELLEEARQQYDYVVLDTPPLVLVPDCRLLARWTDGFLMVVAANKTPRKVLEDALSVLEPAKLIGLVFNGDTGSMSGYYGSYYAYAAPHTGGSVPWWRWRSRGNGRSGQEARR